MMDEFFADLFDRILNKAKEVLGDPRFWDRISSRANFKSVAELIFKIGDVCNGRRREDVCLALGSLLLLIVTLIGEDLSRELSEEESGEVYSEGTEC